MRLLLLDQFSDPGGAQQGLMELLPSIRERGWSAVVGMPGEGELFSKVREIGFAAERIQCGPYTSGSKSFADMGRFLSGTPVLAGQISALAQKLDADLIYVNGPRLLPAVALAGPRAPVLFHSHSFLFPGMVRRLAGRALRHCGAWLAGSCQFVAEPWLPFVRPDRVRIIYNGVAGPAAQRPRRRNRLGPFTVGCIGRIAPEKGQREFVEVAAAMHQTLPDCHFAIYGAALFAEAGAQRYEEEVRAASAQAGVEFRGWVADVYAALESIDLLLVPSAGHEATTRVILEAYSAGVPVIAFRSGGIPEVVEHGRGGWLAGSPAEMARLAIDLLTGDPERRIAASVAAREIWTRRFTLSRYHDQLLEAMEAIGLVFR